MLLALVLIYSVTLLYLCSVERFRYYATIIALQGWLLFFIALLTETESTTFGSIFLFTETSIVKGIIVPYMLFSIIKKTKVNHVHRHSLPPAITVCLAILSLACSVWLANEASFDSTLIRLIFGLSIFGVLVGLILITTHRRIFSHLVGFLVIENSMFLFSMTLGAELPILVNIAVMLDILVGILLLGFVINKVSEHAGTLNSEKLSKLKD